MTAIGEYENYDEYYRHYMSLFLEFIDDFKGLSYMGILLPLLSKFELYINEDVRKKVIRPSYRRTLKRQIYRNEQIQQGFDHYINLMKSKPPKSIKKGGKILLYPVALRFPEEIMRKFNPSKTIILTPNQNGIYYGIPIHSLTDYTNNKDHLVKSIMTRAEILFAYYQKHPIYSDAHFQRKFFEDIPNMIHSIKAINNYFNEKPISCVIVGATSIIESSILALLAASRGIPSICMQHGLLMCKQHSTFLPVLATKQAVYGQYEKDLYTQYGVSEENIEITGHPRFDKINSNPSITKEHFLDQLKIDKDKKSILITTQPSSDYLSHPTFESSPYWNTYIDILAKDPNIEIIIKPHPYEYQFNTLFYYKKYSQLYNSVKVVDQEIDLYSIFHHVDLISMAGSTTGLEGLIANKPVVCLSYNQKFWSNRDYYERLGDFNHLDSEAAAIFTKRILYNESMQQKMIESRKIFLNYAYPNKYAIDKLFDLINKLTEI
ncbi:capsular polysaccharide export protein, LipB/KpsS family [Bacillus sp. FJAT-45350]|uniref:capsular polysaccharide export protein, LipB/KpsS family n=1 Tax=Bacillus sp. FJAT-45350 TaxID=2011014 RepID=UPI000BB7599B|nr:CDP-glycerol glycerophosphotransferase family protein [Bacillus sp. FJAT-45350]